MIQFIICFTQLGSVRFAVYNDFINLHDRKTQEAEVVRRCLQRKEQECSFIQYMGNRLVFRRFGNLFFVVGIDEEENELAVYEFLSAMLEMMDTYYDPVCEFDMLFNLDKTQFIVQEMMSKGCIVETNKANVLQGIRMMDKASA